VKKIRFLFFLILFTATLYIGYRMGFASPAPIIPAEAKKPVETTIISPAPVLPNGQISLLVVTVDDLQSARPHLESAWLVEFVPPDPRLTLLSVYPSFSGADTKLDAVLASSFRVEITTNSLQVGQDFLKVLQDRKLFWSGTVLLDKYALAQTLDYLNRPQPQKSLSETSVSQPVGFPDGQSKVESVPSSSQNPQMALFGQASIYQELCQSASQRDPILDASSQAELGKLLEGHFYHTLDPQKVLPHLKAYYAGSSSSADAAVFCVFPTLPIQSVTAR
jgi:hypothetical protein